MHLKYIFKTCFCTMRFIQKGFSWAFRGCKDSYFVGYELLVNLVKIHLIERQELNFTGYYYEKRQFIYFLEMSSWLHVRFCCDCLEDLCALTCWYDSEMCQTICHSPGFVLRFLTENTEKITKFVHLCASA